MSGIEIAGLVFGIVPVVVEILKSFRSTRDRLKAFTHHAQVIYDVHLRYRVAATSFSNECQLLLKAVVEDARELSEMVEDPHHSGWQDPLLEQRFRIFLGRDDALFEEIVVRIRDVLRETQSELAQLDESSHEHQQSATQRLYNAFNISRKENRYRLWIDDLDQWNTKLRHLRSQRCKLHKRRKTLPPGCLVRKAAPRQYSDIRTASQRLHESLKESWSCSNVSHAGHQAKLSLEAKAEHGTVRLDLAIACQRKPITMSQMYAHSFSYSFLVITYATCLRRSICTCVVFLY